MRKIHTIVACSALVLFLTAAAHAKDVQQKQQCSGSALNLDEFNADSIMTCKKKPGSASSRTLLKLGAMGPASEQCQSQGFALEIPVVRSSTVEVFSDLSKLIGLITSGQICVNLDGRIKAHLEGVYVGGVKRFEDAAGTFSAEFDGVGLSADYPRQLSLSGSLTGTIVLSN